MTDHETRAATESRPFRVLTIEQVALGLYWAWVWLFYESDVLFAGWHADALGAGQFRFASLLAMGVFLMAGAVFSRWLDSNRGTVALSALAVLCGPAGLACLFLPGFSAFPLAGAVLIGAAEGALAFLWAAYIMHFASFRSYQAYSVAVSVVVGALVFLALSHLPWIALAVADAYLPVIAGVICLASRIFTQAGGAQDGAPAGASAKAGGGSGGSSRTRNAGHRPVNAAASSAVKTPDGATVSPSASLFASPQASSGGMSGAANPFAQGFFYSNGAGGSALREYNGLLARVFGALATYGLIYGMLRGLSDTSLSDTSSVAVALFLLVGICLAAYVRTARFKSLTLFWRLIFPVTLLGLVLTPLSGSAGAGLAAPIAQTGYLLFESLVWIILFDVVAQLKLNGIAVFGIGRGITAVSMAAGSFVPDQLLGGALPAFVAANALPTLALLAVALIVVNFFLLNEKEVATAGLLEIRDEDRAQLNTISAEGATSSNLFDNIAARYQLTNRETEVLELLAAGKSGPQISETLVLSKATVKTHTYNIYKKLEVHTRAELLAFVQNFR